MAPVARSSARSAGPRRPLTGAEIGAVLASTLAALRRLPARDRALLRALRRYASLAEAAEAPAAHFDRMIRMISRAEPVIAAALALAHAPARRPRRR